MRDIEDLDGLPDLFWRRLKRAGWILALLYIIGAVMRIFPGAI